MPMRKGQKQPFVRILENNYFKKILHNSQQNTCNGIYFKPAVCILLKKEVLAEIFF